MKIVALPAVPSLAFDTASDFNEAQAAELYSYNYRGAFLYLPLPGLALAAGDLSWPKLEMLARKRFQVGCVQHTRFPGWRPADHAGAIDGAVAAAAAQNAGYPAGAHVFLDIEGVSGTADETKYFAEQWAAAVTQKGFRAGVYCGYQDPLDANGLYMLHGVSCYWTDAGHRAVQTRGCAIHQGPTKVVAGVQIDIDTIGVDLQGDLPILAWGQSDTAA